MSGRRWISEGTLDGHSVTFSVDLRRRLLERDAAVRTVLGVLNVVVERTGSGVRPGGTSGQDNDVDSERF